MRDKLGKFKKFFHKPSTPKRKYMSVEQYAFMKGREKVLEEFNILSVMKTLQKLKAVVSILFESNELDIETVKERYLQNSTI